MSRAIRRVGPTSSAARRPEAPGRPVSLRHWKVRFRSCVCCGSAAKAEPPHLEAAPGIGEGSP